MKARERHQIDVCSVEHQLDADQHPDRVALGGHAHHAAHKQQGAQEQIRLQTDFAHADAPLRRFARARYAAPSLLRLVPCTAFSKSLISSARVGIGRLRTSVRSVAMPKPKTAKSSTPTTAETAHSALLVFMVMNGPCAVSMTPNTTSTRVPPTYTRSWVAPTKSALSRKKMAETPARVNNSHVAARTML